MSTDTIHDVVIVGSGPAGYTAAIYAARANLNPIVIAGMLEPGRELMKTTEVENYRVPEGIQGPDLMANFQAQAERFGAEIIFEDAEAVELDGPVKKVVADGVTYLARAVIITTGSAHRTLGLENEAALCGSGVSYCATCDGSFFAGLDVAVVGGGDSAAEEALFLTKFASNVFLIVRGDEMRASKIMADRVKASPKIVVVYGSQVTALHGEGTLEGVTICIGDVTSPHERQRLVVAIGNDAHRPGQGRLELTEAGTIAVRAGPRRRTCRRLRRRRVID
jgi:thioredoxin reductase (NADPH)